MDIAGEERILAFASRFPKMKNSLIRWINVFEEADWNNPADMKRTFGSADLVGDQTVFNLGGNKCRLIALIHYRTKRVLVQRVLTHAQYDEGDWKQ